MKLLAKILLTAAISTPQFASAQTVIDMFVGCYCTEAEEGIKWYTFNQETGDCQYVSGISGIQNPSFQIFSPDKRYIYSVSENSSDEGQLVSFAVDRTSRKLIRLSDALTHGDDPCHVWVDSKNTMAITANYTGGSITVFNIDNKGCVARDTTIQYDGGYPDNDRQDKAHLHFIYNSPDERYIYADDLGSDRIYKFERSGNKLASADTPYFNVPKGVGPRHAVFHPNGKFLYVIGELSGTIEVFDFDTATGNIDLKQSVQVDPLFASGSGDIHISNDGKFMYASNRLKGDGIAILAVDSTSGILRNTAYQYTGAHPRNFNITPNGKFLLCACRDTNTIQIFSRDTQTGLLTDTGKTITTSRPSSILF